MLDPTEERYPHPRAEEYPKQDGGRGEVTFRVNPIPARDAGGGLTLNLVHSRTQRPHRD